MLEKVIEKTSEYIDSMPKEERKNMVNFLLVLRQLVIWQDCLIFLSS